jgi:hypothetical protein
MRVKVMVRFRIILDRKRGEASVEMAIEYFQSSEADHWRLQGLCQLSDRANDMDRCEKRRRLLPFRYTACVRYELLVHRAWQVHVAVLVVDRDRLP